MGAQFGEQEAALRRYEQAAKLDDHSIYLYRAELAAAGLCLRMNRYSAAVHKYRRVASAIPNTEEAEAARQTLRRIQESSPAMTEGAKLDVDPFGGET